MTAPAASPTTAYSPGLEGIIAGETAIASLEDGLRYRGYAVGELAEHCTYEEVAFLLLYGDLPNRGDLEDFRRRLSQYRQLPDTLQSFLQKLPATVGGMDALRTAVSVLAHYDPDVDKNSTDANIRKAERLLAQIPLAVAQHYRHVRGEKAVASRADLSFSANFLYLVRGTEATAEEIRALDVSLILYAEHDFNASTFTARVVASTESDLHSAVVAAIGALKGPLHGGANERVVDLLKSVGGADHAERWVRDALAQKIRIMGFGHRVYKAGDVRAGILKPYAKRLAEAAGYGELETIAEVIERVMAHEKNLFPNVDWPAGRLYHALGLAPTIYTPMFVMSRVAGWAAHLMEQYRQNRLIRPRSLYTGPGPRVVVPLSQR
jgi:2-methylcitrate synthase/citrate synthase II